MDGRARICRDRYGMSSHSRPEHGEHGRLCGYALSRHPGALLAFLGIVGVPLVILLLLDSVYLAFAHVPQVQSGMHGMAAVATAYMLYMSIKMGGPFWKRPWGLLLGAAAAALALFAHWHMALVLLVCGTVGVVLSKRGDL